MAAPNPNQTPKKAAGDGDWQPVFLKVLSTTANVRASCKAAGIVRTYAYAAREADPDFAAAWNNALEDATDDLEEVARRRAKRVSDTLLIFLLKAHRPEKFRETVRNEHVGKDGGALSFTINIDRRDDGDSDEGGA